MLVKNNPWFQDMMPCGCADTIACGMPSISFACTAFTRSAVLPHMQEANHDQADQAWSEGHVRVPWLMAY